MFAFVISRHVITRDLTALSPTCVGAPPIRLALSQPHCIMSYYPNLVILPVDNNEHQRIDDVSTDRISYDIRSVETMGFAL